MGNTRTARYLRTINRCKSLSRAAFELEVSQPALSAFLKKTESELGTAVFDRKKGMALTAAGALLLEHEEAVEALDRELAENVARVTGRESARLVVGGAGAFNATYLPPAVAAYLERHPQAFVEVVEDTVPNLTRSAVDGDLDLFISPGFESVAELEIRRFATEKLLLCVPKALCPECLGRETDGQGHVLADHSLLAALDDLPFIVLHRTQEMGARLHDLLERHGVKPSRLTTVDQSATGLSLSIAGVGISLVSDKMLAAAGPTDSIVPLLADADLTTRDLHVAHAKRTRLSRAAVEFSDILVQQNSQ